MRGIAVHDHSGGRLSVGPGMITSTTGKPTKGGTRRRAMARGREGRKPRKSQFAPVG